MDLTDQRLACLRMAMELNCNTEPLLKAANELMSFIATGTAQAPAEVLTKQDTETAADPAIDTIAACGTALQMPDVGGLEAAQPANQTATTESPAETSPGESEMTAEPADVAETIADVAAEAAAGPSVDVSTDAATETAADGGVDQDATANDDAPAIGIASVEDSTADGDAAVH